MAQSFETRTRRLSPETLELIRKRGAARAIKNSSPSSQGFAVSREYQMPLFLTSVVVKKDFDSVETESVMEPFNNQGVFAQYTKLLRGERMPTEFDETCGWSSVESAKEDAHVKRMDLIMLNGSEVFECASYV
ncbi:hypothetical protein RB195_001347 [Necator americanus]|uniref:Uncharacterized protein n=1 Tax=Necator americanus TaxID=51031 RepID=A0ABR1DGU6_NECAM